jgi:hypothetical protein
MLLLKKDHVQKLFSDYEYSKPQLEPDQSKFRSTNSMESTLEVYN